MSEGGRESEEILAGFRLLDSAGHLIRRNHQRSYEIFTELVGDDVTRQQVALLIALTQNPGVTQNTLVAATGFDRATIAEMLKRMVARGWVARSRDPQDARAWALHTTPQGREVVLQRIEQIVAVQDEILRPLPEALRPVFIHCLRLMIGLETVAPASAHQRNVIAGPRQRP